jgi:hypothetical protein
MLCLPPKGPSAQAGGFFYFGSDLTISARLVPEKRTRFSKIGLSVAAIWHRMCFLQETLQSIVE